MFSVAPISDRPSTPVRNANGMAMPMNSEARPPRHEQDDDRHQQNGGDDAVLQVAQHLPDELGLVADVADGDLVAPARLQLRNGCLHRVDGVDEVGAAALGYLDHHRRLAVDPGDRRRVLEGRAGPWRRRPA